MGDGLPRFKDKWPQLPPRRLSSRIAWHEAVPAVVACAAIALVVWIGVSGHLWSLSLERASALLALAHTDIELQATRFDASVRAVVGQSGPTWSGSAATLAEGLSDACAYALVDADGRIAASAGPPADVGALVDYARSSSATGASVADIPSGPVIVAVQRASATPATEEDYVLVAARQVDLTGAAVDRTSWAVLSASGTPAEDGWRSLDPPAGYLAAIAKSSGGAIHTRASLAGADGSPAMVLEVSFTDPRLGGRQPWWALLVCAAAIGITALMTYVASRRIATVEGRSLAEYTKYVEDQGFLALQGLRPEAELMVDNAEPEEIADLGEAINALLRQLRSSQSELIDASEQSAANERAFRMVVEESPELKLLVRDGVVEIANPAAAHFFGLRMGDLVRADPAGLFAGVRFYDEANVELEPLDLMCLTSEESTVARCVVEGHPDRWLELSVAVLDADQSDYVFSARDITEERRVEALRNEITSLVSHDLRSPLTVVRGYLDILEKPLDDAARRKAIVAARRSTEDMEQLLEDLLRTTRAERVLALRVMRPVDLGSLTVSVAASLQTTAAQRIVVRTEDDVTVLGDPVRLRQAVTNLVANAIKYGPEEGTIDVEAEHRDDRVVLSVHDQGPGIPEEAWETLFERGTRGPGTTAVPGSGLGLYIVRVVAEAHGGSARIEAHDSGTRFILELPAAERPQPYPDSARSALESEPDEPLA